MTDNRIETARALSLTHPYGPLIALGKKRYETRSWSTDYRGPLVIHCALKLPGDELDFARDLVALYDMTELATSPLGCFARLVDLHGNPRPGEHLINRGLALGWCALLDCHRTEDVRDDLSAQERLLGGYGDRRFAFELGPFTPFAQPITPPAGGFHLGLWRWYEPLVGAAA